MRSTRFGGCGQGTMFGNLMEEVDQIQLRKDVFLEDTNLFVLIEKVRKHETIYKQAGAVHGCALATLEGEILMFVEDVGRHNAVDAIAGFMWLDAIDGSDKIFYTTGRLTSEMVIKCAQMASFLSALGLHMGTRRKEGELRFSAAPAAALPCVHDGKDSSVRAAADCAFGLPGAPGKNSEGSPPGSQHRQHKEHVAEAALCRVHHRDHRTATSATPRKPVAHGRQRARLRRPVPATMASLSGIGRQPPHHGSAAPSSPPCRLAASARNGICTSATPIIRRLSSKRSIRLPISTCAKAAMV